MGVHTELSAEQIAAFVRRYDIGSLRSASPIETGIENSNFAVETDGGAFVLTVFEKRVDPGDLPYFAELLAHVGAKGLPVAPPIADREGDSIQKIAGKRGWLVPFLEGVSPIEPGTAEARAAGDALGRLHQAAEGFPAERKNDLGLGGWHRMADTLGDRLESIESGLTRVVNGELAFLDARWPSELPMGTVHGDLFPDNVLMTGGRVTGLIDFYFACTDLRAYDLAVMHAAWSFRDGGRHYEAAIGDALIAGYRGGHSLSAAEAEHFGVLCRGACLRFLLTRASDWFAEGPVHRKDPLAFARRLAFYAAASERLIAS